LKDFPFHVDDRLPPGCVVAVDLGRGSVTVFTLFDAGGRAVSRKEVSEDMSEHQPQPCGFRSCLHPDSKHRGRKTERGLACVVPGCPCLGFVELIEIGNDELADTGVLELGLALRVSDVRLNPEPPSTAADFGAPSVQRSVIAAAGEFLLREPFHPNAESVRDKLVSVERRLAARTVPFPMTLTAQGARDIAGKWIDKPVVMFDEQAPFTREDFERVERAMKDPQAGPPRTVAPALLAPCLWVEFGEFLPAPEFAAQQEPGELAADSILEDEHAGRIGFARCADSRALDMVTLTRAELVDVVARAVGRASRSLIALGELSRNCERGLAAAAEDCEKARKYEEATPCAQNTGAATTHVAAVQVNFNQSFRGVAGEMIFDVTPQGLADARAQLDKIEAHFNLPRAVPAAPAAQTVATTPDEFANVVQALHDAHMHLEPGGWRLDAPRFREAVAKEFAARHGVAAPAAPAGYTEELLIEAVNAVKAGAHNLVGEAVASFWLGRMRTHENLTLVKFFQRAQERINALDPRDYLPKGEDR
jgi:hypothetical protein